jgi:hypothetical protein
MEYPKNINPGPKIDIVQSISNLVQAEEDVEVYLLRPRSGDTQLSQNIQSVNQETASLARGLEYGSL